MGKIVITGGAGFIGCNFVRQYVEQYPDQEIVVLDKLTYAGRMENLEDVMDNIAFIKGDICRKEDVEKALDKNTDLVVNFAAESHVDRSIEDPSSFIRTDIFGTHTLLEAARKFEIPRYIQISTDEVYGSIASGSFTEESPFDPSSPYSASKASADMLVNSYFKTYGLPVVITRSSNNFGPYQFPEKLIPFFILMAHRDSPLPVYGDGMNVRDWIYVADNCKAIDFVARNGKLGEVYNIGGGNERTNIEITKKLLAAVGKPESLIEYVKDRPGHDLRYSLDSSKLEALGWKPEYDFEKALSETVRWYLENEAWWKGLDGV